jgi:hypothetical protein
MASDYMRERGGVHKNRLFFLIRMVRINPGVKGRFLVMLCVVNDDIGFVGV